jgi:VWFA-related protein
LLPAGSWLAASPAGQATTAGQTTSAGQATSPPQGQNPVFRAGTNLVMVDAYPLKDGKIVEGLTAEDFQVSEDGKPQKVEAFEFFRIEPTPTDTHKDPNTVAESMAQAADPHNRVFVTFLDTHFVRLSGGYYANKPLIDILDRVLAPNDLFGVMTPAMRPQDVTFGRKVDTVDSELTKFWTWGQRGSVKIVPEGDLRRYCYSPPPTPTGDYQSIRDVPMEVLMRSWEEQTLQSLEDLSLYLGRVREARTAVMVLSDGWAQYEPNENLVNAILATGNAGDSRMPGTMTSPGRLGIPGTATSGLGQQDVASCTNEMTRLARSDNKRRIRDVIAAANRNNVTFYSVNPDGLIASEEMMGDPTDRVTQMQQAQSVARQGGAKAAADQLMSQMATMGNRTDSLMEIAENTNGIAVVNTNDLATGLKKIVDEVSAYYLLGYYSTNPKTDNSFRRIDVKVNRPNVKVAARRGYTANRGIDAPKAGLKASGVAEGAFGSLAKIQPDAELYATGVVAADGLLVAAEIPSRMLAEWSAGGEVTVTATSKTGEKLPPVTGKIEPGTRGALVKVPLAATTGGPWRVQVAIKGAPGTLQDATEVATSKGALVGDALVYRGAPGARSAIRPVADMQFYRTERVHIEWPELKPLDQRTARLLGRNGQPLAVSVNLTEREQDGHQVLAADVLLGPLAPADYVIELTVAGGGATETRVVGIRVQ